MTRWLTVTSRFLVLAIAAMLAMPAQANVLHYRASLAGPNESPANSSPALGYVELTIDDVANTMRIQNVFASLQGTTNACHIHGPTLLPLSGTAGVATTTPAFAGYPLGVSSGAYDHTLDLTQSSTYNAPFVTANGGTPAGAEAALLQMIADGKAYFNIHTTAFPGGEIRGFLVGFDPTPTRTSTWSRVKGLFR